MRRSRAVWILGPSLLVAGGILAVLLFLVAGGGDAERPDLLWVDPPIDELPLSAVTVTLAYDPTPLMRELEEAIPVGMGSLDHRYVHPSVPALHYSFVAERDPFHVELRGDSVRIGTEIRYGGRVWYSAPFGLELTTSCGVSGTGDAVLRTRVDFASPIEIASDWTLRSEVRLDRLEPVSTADRCVIAALDFELDVTDELLRTAEEWFQDQADRIDAVLADAHAADHLHEYWELMRSPIDLGNDAWLTLGPEALRFGELRGSGSDGEAFRAELRIAARPRISFGTRPDLEGGLLPPYGEGLMGDEDGIFVEGRVDYDAVSAIAADGLRGMELQLLGRPLRIADVEISGVGDGRIGVDLDVDGALRGRLELVGTPVFDAVSNEIRVPDLEFRVPSGSLLMRSLAWVLQVGFPNRVRELARWPVDDALAHGRVLADRGLNLRFSDEIRLEGTMGAMEVTGILASDDVLVVWGRVEATTELVIAQE